MGSGEQETGIRAVEWIPVPDSFPELANDA
jgi:hypothetical protein